MRIGTSRRALVELLPAIAIFVFVPVLVAAQPVMSRVSVATDGTQANDQSGPGGISADGRWVAFSSAASNLVAGDTNDASDVFVHDRHTGTTTRVSLATGGGQGNSSSFEPVISADGRWVAFNSWASNLVTDDTNGEPDVFLHDRQTGVTTRVSVGPGATQATSQSRAATISAEGRWVAFYSEVSNLVPGDTNGEADVFVHDRETGMTARVSVGPGGSQGNAQSVVPSISADGRFVAFYSWASNLVPEDSNDDSDVFVHDRQTGITTRASVGTGGSQAVGTPGTGARFPTISADGRWVAFICGASNLVPDDTNGETDVFVHDRQTGTTTRVSVGPGGAEANRRSVNAAISADGRWVAFDSWASNLVADDTNDEPDVFVHDRQTGTTTRVSVGSGAVEGNGGSHGLHLGISADGSLVTFLSVASNLVPDDTNNQFDVFVHDRGDAACTTTLAPSSASTPAAGAAGRVMVLTAAGCGWTAASSDPDWLTVTAGASGTGFGIVEFGAATNTGASRRGTLTIGGQVFILEQADPETPLAPTGLRVDSVAGNVVTLRWTIPPGGPAPTGFVLEGGVQPGEVLVSIPTGAVPAFRFQAPSGSFRARVHALNGAARSAASNEVGIHVNVPLVPSAPAHFQAVVNGSSVTLAWINTYEGGTPTALVLEVYDANQTRIPIGLVDHVSLEGTPAGIYRVGLRALNAAGRGDRTSTLTLTVPGPCSGPPAVPTDFVAFAVDRTVWISWAPGPAGPAPTAYVLIATGTVVDARVLTERALGAAVGPGRYVLSVVAVNPCGISAGTTPQTVVVP